MVFNETFRLEYVRCGKGRCWCSGASNGRGHGPYWYAYRREKGSVRKRYVGKTRQGPEQDAKWKRPHDADPGRSARAEEPADRWAYEGRMTLRAALRIMAFASTPALAELKARRRRLVAEHHPDVGGSTAVCQAINAAYDFLARLAH